MKSLIRIGLLAIFATLAIVSSSGAQFRSDLQKEDNEKLNTLGAMSGTHSEDQSFFERLFDPTRFSMHQIYSMSYTTMPGVGGIGMGVFTNTMSFRAADNLIISADVSAVYSPYNSFAAGSVGSQIAKDMNGVYLSSARLDWKMGDNSYLTIAYSGGPQNGFGSGFGGYSNPFYGSPFSNPMGAVSASPFAPKTVGGSFVH